MPIILIFKKSISILFVRNYLFYICFLIATTGVRGQGHNALTIDSLAKALSKAPTAETRVDILNELALSYFNIDLKKSQSYGQDAFELSKQVLYEKGEEKALSILTRVQRRLGNYSVALEFNLRQINIAEKRKDTLRIIEGYTSLGNIYSSIGNLQESKKYFKRAYLFGQKLKVKNLSTIINFSGRVYTQNGEYDSALYWIKQALTLETTSPQDDYTISYIYINLGEAYYFKKDYTRSIYYYTSSLQLPEERQNSFGKTFSLNGLALSYLALKDYQKAKDLALQSIDLSFKHSYRDKTKESYGILYKVYEEMKDYKNALHYYKEYNIHQDSIFSEDKLQYIENLRVYFETERMSQENELLRKDAELKDVRIQRGQFIAIIALISSISLAGAFLFLYQNYKQKKNTNLLLSEYNKNLESQVEVRTKELVKTNLELIKQNNQLEQFGYITAHNLRAPVARILGLANIINNAHFSMPADKEVLDKLQQAALELDTIIYDLNVILDIKKGVHYSYEMVDIEDRLEKVKSILKDKIKDSNAILHSHLTVRKCYAIPAYIESILYNLISNSIKYRSPDRNLEVTISATKDNGKLHLTIRDNGIGMEMDKVKDKLFSLYQRFHDHVEGKGIGLYLVKTQVEALNGTINIESQVNKGTKFHIIFPMKDVAVPS